MALPESVHQQLVFELSSEMRTYIKANSGKCMVFISPFAVNLDADDKNGSSGIFQ
jgi:hypothetical protein